MVDTMQLLLSFIIVWLVGSSTAFVPSTAHYQRLGQLHSAVDDEVSAAVDANLALLKRAAETKQEDSDIVYQALEDLEKQMRTLAKNDPSVAEQMKANLTGDWRLVFTTGTAKTQQKFGKINYFPLKAVQSFRTNVEPMTIENGIYVGDWAVLKFSGVMDFDVRKRRLEFDFDKVALFNGLFDIPLKAGEAAQLGSKSGLGSDSNVERSKKGQAAFFNWISADEDVATARGGGGGLALWKRVG